MKKAVPNISYTVKNNLCTGCGICEGVCPTHSITMEIKKGKFIPSVDERSCINKKNCTRCYDTCPGIGVDLISIAKDSFPFVGIKQDFKVGRYLECYTGYSTNYDIRYHSASGGMISQFLIWLLEKKYIDGAVVTAFDPNNTLLVRSFIATNKEEILSAKGSKYAPVSMHQIVRNIKKKEGKFIIVGLPCHIHGFKKYEKIDKSFKEKIIGYFGIYCSSGRSFYLTEHVLQERKIDKEKLQYLAYRDEGCLGSLVIKGVKQDGVTPFKYTQRYQDYYHPLRSFFIPRRCLTCIDHFAELADVSFGDIHVEPYIEDKVGINSVVVRNTRYIEWFREASEEGCIIIDPLDVNTLIKSQNVIFMKKYRSASFMKLDRLRGRKTPQYDITLKDTSFFKSTISYVHTLSQIFIGNQKKLWFIIKLLKKNTQNLK